MCQAIIYPLWNFYRYATILSMDTAKKQTPKIYVTTERADVVLIAKLKRELKPKFGKLTNTALVRIALRNLAGDYGPSGVSK